MTKISKESQGIVQEKITELKRLFPKILSGGKAKIMKDVKYCQVDLNGKLIVSLINANA